MWAWLVSHVAVVLICLGLLVMVAGAVLVLARDKKRGRSSCGGNCGCCPMGGRCHGADAGKKEARP